MMQGTIYLINSISYSSVGAIWDEDSMNTHFFYCIDCASPTRLSTTSERRESP